MSTYYFKEGLKLMTDKREAENAKTLLEANAEIAALKEQNEILTETCNYLSGQVLRQSYRGDNSIGTSIPAYDRRRA